MPGQPRVFEVRMHARAHRNLLVVLYMVATRDPGTPNNLG